MARIKLICATCGSPDVYTERTITSIWNVDTQNWDFGDPFDQTHCNDCGKETKLDKVELPPKLYLVTANDDDGENQDQFVRASSPEEAVEHFRKLWTENGSEKEEIPKITHIFEVPQVTGAIGPVFWVDLPDHYKVAEEQA